LGLTGAKNFVCSDWVKANLEIKQQKQLNIPIKDVGDGILLHVA